MRNYQTAFWDSAVSDNEPFEKMGRGRIDRHGDPAQTSSGRRRLPNIKHRLWTSPSTKHCATISIGTCAPNPTPGIEIGQTPTRNCRRTRYFNLCSPAQAPDLPEPHYVDGARTGLFGDAGCRFSRRRRSAHRHFPKEIERWDIERIVEDYASAAQRMQATGLDGIEFEAYGHLMGGFWPPATKSPRERVRRRHRKPQYSCGDL